MPPAGGSSWYHCAVSVSDVGSSGDRDHDDRWRTRRFVLLGVYVVAFVVTSVAWGIPASRDRVLAWVIVGLLIVVAGRPHALVRLVVDFLPVVVFLFAYDLLRGAADGVFSHVYDLPQIRVDEWLFGGTVPTVRLQRALWTPGHPQVWDYAAFLVYLTYFLAPITVAAVLWWKAPKLFRRYVSLWIGLSFAALVTYTLYPASPPWLASHQGLVPHVARIAPVIAKDLGVKLSRVMGSQQFVNKVAAVPSLHAATALLIAMFFWSRTTRWRWLLALYPIAMGLSLVYLGEHYAFDVLLGWIYAVVVFVFGNWLYDACSAWSAARHGHGAALPVPEPEARNR